jgi:hypothetical protein
MSCVLGAGVIKQAQMVRKKVRDKKLTQVESEAEQREERLSTAEPRVGSEERGQGEGLLLSGHLHEIYPRGKQHRSHAKCPSSSAGAPTPDEALPT